MLLESIVRSLELGVLGTRGQESLQPWQGLPGAGLRGTPGGRSLEYPATER